MSPRIAQPHRSKGLMRSSIFAVSIALLVPVAALGQDVPPSSNVPRRPAVIYSCMTPPTEPILVDGDTPQEVERANPGFAITRFRRWSIPGMSLWLVTGRTIVDGQAQRYAHLAGFDGQRVYEGAELFRCAMVDDPFELARRALEILIWRAGQLPLLPRDAPGLAELVRPLIHSPVIQDGTLLFWARNRPDIPYATQIRVELDMGRANVGAVW